MCKFAWNLQIGSQTNENLSVAGNSTHLNIKRQVASTHFVCYARHDAEKMLFIEYSYQCCINNHTIAILYTLVSSDYTYVQRTAERRRCSISVLNTLSIFFCYFVQIDEWNGWVEGGNAEHEKTVSHNLFVVYPCSSFPSLQNKFIYV